MLHILLGAILHKLCQVAFKLTRDPGSDHTGPDGAPLDAHPADNLLQSISSSTVAVAAAHSSNARSRWRFWQAWRRRKPTSHSTKVPFHVVSVLRSSLNPQIGLAAPAQPSRPAAPNLGDFVSDGTSTQGNSCCLATLLEAPAICQRIVAALYPNIQDMMALACTTRGTWVQLADLDNTWRDMYLDNEPLATPEFRRLMTGSKAMAHCAATLRLPISGLSQTVWLRTCCLLYAKPKIIVVLAGKDPILMRRLGQPEKEAQAITIGINYHLDDFLDNEDEKHFSIEFPQLFQDLNVGDLVITQDYKGAGCWTAVLDPAAPPGPANYLILKKNNHDTAGYGILTAEVAPPSFPLFYYSDVEFSEEDEIDLRSLKGHEVYWYAYTQLKCGTVYSWSEQEFFQDLAF